MPDGARVRQTVPAWQRRWQRLGPAARRTAPWIGRLAAACALAVIGYRMATTPWVAHLSSSKDMPVAGALACVAASLANLMLVAGWWALLRAQGERVDLRFCLSSYGRSQIAKYLPGGVLQYAGRHLLSPGLDQRRVLIASVVEAASLVTLAGGIGLVTKTLLPSLHAGLVVAGLSAAAAAACLVLRRLRFRLRWMLVAVACNLSYLLLQGASLYALVNAQAPATAFNALFVVGLAAVAWAAGFVVVGAPAGLGVREAVLLGFLSGHLVAEASLAVVAVFRIAALVGDAALFLLASAIRRAPARAAAAAEKG